MSKLFLKRLLKVAGPFLFVLALITSSASAANEISLASSNGPLVLVLFDGPDDEVNPARSDALMFATLLGHFTTRRTIKTFEEYRAGEWKSYDAVFCIVYKKSYTVPELFLKDTPSITKPFCWINNQVGQLDRYKVLQKHGLHFEKLWVDPPFTHVLYKNRLLEKGDPDTNIITITDPSKVAVLAEAKGPKPDHAPYIIRSGSFWIITDSPYSYAKENDRYLAVADVLHDILNIQHEEDHRALIRIEDLNATSNPDDLKGILKIFKKQKIPFSFGYVPVYVDPKERLYLHLWERPEVVNILNKYVDIGGAPVLHGYTHQYRGTSTDDYEFWDDLRDRPVRGDSEKFVAKRLEEGIKQSLICDLYPVTWETPHYAASKIDYRVMGQFFNTVYERVITTAHLGSDPLLPYPVIDLYGRTVIPENMAYIPIDDQNIKPLMESAEAALVVRDGYASAFFHPFLNPHLLDSLISGYKNLGYRFFDIKKFPNKVQSEGQLITTESGEVQISGSGLYLNEMILKAGGGIRQQKSVDAAGQAVVHRTIKLEPGETYVATLQNEKTPTSFQRLLSMAKGDISAFKQKKGVPLTGRSVQEPFTTVVLWNKEATGAEKIDQESFFVTLSNLGFDPEKIDYRAFTKEQEDLKAFTLLVIPHASAQFLPVLDVERVMKELNQGIVLVTDGESPLSRALGITIGEPMKVQYVLNNASRFEEIRWSETPNVSWIAQPLTEQDTVFYSDREHERPLVMGGEHGQGRYLFFAPLYDPKSGVGYGRFPDFPSILCNEYEITPMFKRNGADVYFDPGYRQNISIERLAKQWRRSGVRTLHAASWHFYDKYSYDYTRLIKVAHQNGILVYAWFEWPHVSQRFWNDHPEWREKTATLVDAKGGWRPLMNLHDPRCLKAVLTDMEKLMKAHDWDGINMAEMTFESPAGPERPDLFTPFNSLVRKEFEKKHGIDPVDIFNSNSPMFWKKNHEPLNQFYAYRKLINSELLSTFLNQINTLSAKNKKNWEIVLTVLDVTQHPELSNYLGMDLEDTLKLVNKFNTTLQVEDPESEWSKEPERYISLGERYHRFHLKNPFMIDINILPVHKPKQLEFVTDQPTGSEMLQLWRCASSQSDRVCFYSESTIFEQDWGTLPYAMAADARVTKEGDEWVVQTPNTVTLELGRGSRKITLDDQPWAGVNNGEVLIPAGEHRLKVNHTGHSWLDKTQLESHLISITGELLGLQVKNRGLELEYRSQGRCAMMFDKLPQKILLDGDSISNSALKGDNGYVVMGPPGQHRLRILTQTPFSYLIDFTGWVTASLFVLFGLVSSGLLAILFLLTYINRRLRIFHRHILGVKKGAS